MNKRKWPADPLFDTWIALLRNFINQKITTNYLVIIFSNGPLLSHAQYTTDICKQWLTSIGLEMYENWIQGLSMMWQFKGPFNNNNWNIIRI